MSWVDFFFGMSMGALALCAIILLVCAVACIYDSLASRIKALEDVGRDEGER